MHFVGLDLAWGERSQTGVAAIDADGKLLHVGAASDDDSIAAAIAPFTGGDCLVAIDAPLIVPNETGSRSCEKELNRDFHAFEAGARPSFRGRPEFNPPRGEVLAARLGLDLDPASPTQRRAVEVFPHPASVVLFGLKKTLKYKKGPFADRKTELLKLMTHIEGLDNESPQLRVNRNPAWIELRRRVEASTRPVHLDRDEDPVDAVVCAYVALYWYHRPEDVTIYGEYPDGYIVTPTLPLDRTTAPKATARRDDDVLARLENVQAMIERAQRELTAIRRQLGG